jgi:sterol desaturase/sphingolipid hydroxylase (fatty acid hydroxylase superfamily)
MQHGRLNWQNPPPLWRRMENLIFIAVFAYTTWGLSAGLARYSWASTSGHGFLSDLLKPLGEKHYHESVLAIVALLISVLTLWELLLFFIQLARKDPGRAWSRDKLLCMFNATRLEYQPTFLAGLLLGLLPRLIVLDVFWLLLPSFHRFALFSVGFGRLGWLYALLLWDLSTWVWHFGAHKVRVLWCLHSPHHAPQNLNMTVAWVHFFAEGYYSALVQVPMLMVLGVQPAMLVVIMSFEVTWGTFIHAGERSFRSGRLGWARFFVITPSYHRVHHARNPLYMDTNFCTLLPFWDWLFGTLQPLRDDIKIEYGITRDINVTSFVDFYFGELLLLGRDLRKADNWRTRLLYIVMPPGWSPKDAGHTAGAARAEFLRANPHLHNTGGLALLRRSLDRRRGAAPRTASP